MGRNGFFNMIYFGFYHSTKDLIPASTDPKLGKTQESQGIRQWTIN